MTIAQIIPYVEALIFASGRPLPALEMVDLLNNSPQDELADSSLDKVESAIEAIREKYQTDFYAFELKESGGGYQFLTKAAFHQVASQLNGDKYIKKLSTAALETLAIIAYRQPASKSEIELIRGVNSDYSVHKLLEKDLIVISGRDEKHPGKPLLYSTSESFMDYFGLNSPADLPKIREIFNEEELINPTDIKVINANGIMKVKEDGKLTLNGELYIDNQDNKNIGRYKSGE